MEHPRKLRTIIFLLASILGFELLMLLVMIRPVTLFIGITLGIVLIVGIYLTVIALGLLKQLDRINNKKRDIHL